MQTKKNRNRYISAFIVAACGLVFSSSILGFGQTSATSSVRESLDPDHWLLKCTDFYSVERSDIAVLVSDGSIYFNSFWLNGRTIVKELNWAGGSMSENTPQNVLSPGAPPPSAFPEVAPGCLTEGSQSWNQWKKDKAVWESMKVDSQKD